MPEFVTNGVQGTNVTTTYTGTTTDGENAPFRLGTIVRGTNNREFVFVQAGAAISTVVTTQPFFLAIDENFQAVKITKALASAGHMVGVAPPVIIPDNEFFWAVTKGANVPVKVAVSCAADVNLWTTATAGVLDDTSGGSHVVVLGAKIVLAASASASAGSTVRNAIITNTLVPQLIA